MAQASRKRRLTQRHAPQTAGAWRALSPWRSPRNRACADSTAADVDRQTGHTKAADIEKGDGQAHPCMTTRQELCR